MIRAFSTVMVCGASLAFAACAATSAIEPDARGPGDAAEPPRASDAGPDASGRDVLAPADVANEPTPDATTPTVDAAPDVVSDAATEPAVDSPCGRFPGTQAWNCGSDGLTLTRSLGGVTETHRCDAGCVGLPFGFDDQCRVRTGLLGNSVNGHALATAEAAWIHYAAYCAVPQMQGDRDTRLTNASRVAWWSLKEGVLDTSSPDPVGFSLCTTGSGDARIGPLATCGATAPWQVGAAGVQVTCCSLSAVESMAMTLFPGTTSDDVLSATAIEADYPSGSATHDGIVHSTGALRTSWLLHNSAIGFTFQAPAVTDQCVTGSRSWCYGSGWSTSAAYAPTPSAAVHAMADVRAMLDALAP